MPLQPEPWVGPILEIAGFAGTILTAWKVTTGQNAVNKVERVTTAKRVRLHGKKIRCLEDGFRDIKAEMKSGMASLVKDVRSIDGKLDKLQERNERRDI